MEKILFVIVSILKHLYKQASDYCLSLGVIFICRFIYIKHGFDTLLLFVGVLLILFAFVMEINKKNVKKQR